MDLVKWTSPINPQAEIDIGHCANYKKWTNVQANFVALVFSETKCENISMKQLTFMWFRRKFTTITRYISEPVSETDDLIKY